MRFLLTFFLACSLSFFATAQLSFKHTLKANQEKLYRNLVQNSINKNLSLALTDSTEEAWQSAFDAIEVIRYKSMWVDGKIKEAVAQLPARSIYFQRAVVSFLYGSYPDIFYNDVKLLLMQTSDNKVFSLCCEYILHSNKAADDFSFLSVKTQQRVTAQPDDPFLIALMYRLMELKSQPATPSLDMFFRKNYLPGKVLIFSFQRKNRDYPGLVMVRDGKGNFVTDTTGQYFSVPQLARSNSNLPGYLTNGNTPEGFFRMKGYDVSRSNFIGPTVNVQLTMPFERTPANFYANDSIADTIWSLERYKKLLPEGTREYFPLYQSFFAGKAGRTEIIIHGSTVNPQYYAGQPYFPLTPTQGCLTSKEFWDPETGQRKESDQQLLINALIKAGGPDGYAIVINIDDEQRAVLLADILPYLNKK